MNTAYQPGAVAVFGPGLLGGSVALAVRAYLPGVEVRLWARREEAVKELRASGIADEVSGDVAAVARGADLAILCTPVGAMAEVASLMAPALPEGALVTDVGSVKAPLVQALAPVFARRAEFVGSHPMAGSEKTGFGHARADLFRGAVCLVTPSAASSARAVAAVESFWAALGGVVRRMDPAEHDRAVALVSHLPHAAASALVNYVCSQGRESLMVCGPGFLDTTRVASGSPGMWEEILATNGEAVRAALLGYAEELRRLAGLLGSGAGGPLREYLAAAKEGRDGIHSLRAHGTP